MEEPGSTMCALWRRWRVVSTRGKYESKRRAPMAQTSLRLLHHTPEGAQRVAWVVTTRASTWLDRPSQEAHSG